MIEQYDHSQDPENEIDISHYDFFINNTDQLKHKKSQYDFYNHRGPELNHICVFDYVGVISINKIQPKQGIIV